MGVKISRFLHMTEEDGNINPCYPSTSQPDNNHYHIIFLLFFSFFILSITFLLFFKLRHTSPSNFNLSPPPQKKKKVTLAIITLILNLWVTWFFTALKEWDKTTIAHFPSSTESVFHNHQHSTGYIVYTHTHEVQSVNTGTEFPAL